MPFSHKIFHAFHKLQICNPIDGATIKTFRGGQKIAQPLPEKIEREEMGRVCEDVRRRSGIR